FRSLEATLRYLVTIGVSDLFHCLSHRGGGGEELEKYHGLEFLRRPTTMSLGRWHRALQETAQALQCEPGRVLVELPEVCGRGGRLDEQIAWLIHYRNECIHESGSITLSPEECQERKREARPRQEEVLHAVRFICNYPLGFLRRRSSEGAGDASYRYHLHSGMGTQVANTKEAYVVESPRPLQEQNPFLVAAD